MPWTVNIEKRDLPSGKVLHQDAFVDNDLDAVLGESWVSNGLLQHQFYPDQETQDDVLSTMKEIWEMMRAHPHETAGYFAGERGEIIISICQTDKAPALASPNTVSPLDGLLLGPRHAE